MLDLGFEEMAVIVVVALLVIGPKDLPLALRTAAKWVRKARSLAGEFHKAVDDMVEEAELSDVKKQVERIGNTNFKREVEKTIDPKGEMEKALRLEEGKTVSSAAAPPSATPVPETTPVPELPPAAAESDSSQGIPPKTDPGKP
ncbi:Sec-independent protein translocase protein TatB [Telmatospirillum sp. J64-1]|uniref:Sec-independent protein translocase protein TatB n=1 Tax=Telmatospirillum sp. J64-1 TaxID=2502183 RepID=UPI00115F6A7E|nr:Sec-independent protein translocase protein TatB [Telmatospirillum sp. J64-1]